MDGSDEAQQRPSSPENAGTARAVATTARSGIADPVWCVHGHFDSDRRADRRHQGEPVVMRLALADVVDRGDQWPHPDRWVPAALVIRLTQRLDEIHPALTLYRDPTATDSWVRCTPGEAEHLADLLGRAAALAEAPLPTERALKGPFWQDTACPSWCASLHQPEDAYEDRTHFGDLPSAAGATLIDLLLETAAEGRPEQLEVSVAQHYRSTTARVHVSKSEQAELRLTPAEARTLAAHLLTLVQTAGIPVDTTWPRKPIEDVTVGGAPAFPCPHRLPWCIGHTKAEITEYRQLGNHLLHSGPITSVPFITSGSPGSIDITISSLTDRAQPFAYLQLLGGDGGAELDVTTIDQTIAALQFTRKFILEAQPGS
ncbi:DUF6907 domain-containing protein [Micromonospora sp. NPDC047762]|uniref:DUF6907 domain-containing protein n=1 Tax=Micromonospora sp. NPDC047762 TaxID=3364255 RepID=UPI0037248762